MGSLGVATAKPDFKTAADLMGVLPASTEVVDGHLHIAGVDMVELAREAGTALYVMDEEHIRTQLRDYRKWMSYHWQDVDVIYAGKAFLSK
ncbi:MAG: diaminopimelate decarboxylase, partial [Coriobacteriia bacterium]|nr:diaminopimelate decarboxylase [Coriobacteriia bacterium]